MSKSLINLGTNPNDRTGDTLRDAGSKVNSNVNELYTALGDGTTLQVSVDGATSGQVLKFNGTAFVPATDANTDAVTSVNGEVGVVVLDTDLIEEGETNQYFTAERAQAAISVDEASTQLSYDAGVISFTQGDTDTVAEGDNNLYYTTGRFEFTLSQKTTDDLTEGETNLYFADSLARAAISATGTVSYDTETGVITGPTLANVATSGSYGDLTGVPTLADVATSGSYNDLSDTPTLLQFSTAPSTAKGATGDLSGNIARDSGYIYLCTADWTAAPTYETTATRDATGTNTYYIADTEDEPLVGGKFQLLENAEQNITAVAIDGTDWQIVVDGDAHDVTIGDTIAITGLQADIWKRTAVSTW